MISLLHYKITGQYGEFDYHHGMHDIKNPRYKDDPEWSVACDELWRIATNNNHENIRIGRYESGKRTLWKILRFRVWNEHVFVARIKIGMSFSSPQIHHDYGLAFRQLDEILPRFERGLPYSKNITIR